MKVTKEERKLKEQIDIANHIKTLYVLLEDVHILLDKHNKLFADIQRRLKLLEQN